MLNVLLVARLGSGNRYTDDLYHSMIEQDVNLDISEEAFWNAHKKYDIVHVEWIETLFNWRLDHLSKQDLMRLKFRLQTFSEQGTKLVITRHNKLPHAFQNDKRVQEMYRLIYENTSGIVHLGHFSVADFKLEQPTLHHNIKHRVIGHGNYKSLKNDLSKQAARTRLGIDAKRFVIVAFGAVRNRSERDMMFSAFEQANIPNKTLLVNRWRIQGQKLGKLSDLYQRIKAKYLRMRKEYILQNIFTQDNDVQMYMNAADALIIPRVNTLNSGNLYLGLTFGKVIIAPAIGNITETVKETGNILFKPNDLNSISSAIEKATELVETDLPFKNMEYAKQKCNWDLLAQEHLSFYHQLINTKA